jgi:hypothetical protein
MHGLPLHRLVAHHRAAVRRGAALPLSPAELVAQQRRREERMRATWNALVRGARAALLLLALVGATSALESWGAPDLHQQDKREHAMGGALVGSFSAALAGAALPRAPWWQQALVGIAASAVVGVAKEITDARHPGTHDADPKDAIATVAGGAIGAVAMTLVWRF